MAYFYEFIGLPGAGKSTISSNVIEEIRKESCILDLDEIQTMKKKFGRSSDEIKNKILNYLYYFIKYPKITVSALVYGIRVAGINRTVIQRVYSLLNTYHQLLNMSKRVKVKYILLDQGLLQDIWAIGIYGKGQNTKTLKPLIKSLKLLRDFQIINCEAHVDEVIKRIENRPTNKSRFDNMTTRDAHKIIENQKKTMVNIIDQSKVCFNLRTLKVNSQYPIVNNTKKIKEFMIYN